jgi:D-serine deaminase-like pyridoxal phosphate-dependent protein
MDLGETTMTTRPPAEVGMTLEEVDTPALLIELDAFEANLKALADALAGTSVKLRPHGKAHKCPIIGRQQMALGAVGLCCQKVSEAEAMVFGGVTDIYVTNEIVGARKLARLAPLAHQARIATCIDNLLSVATLGEAARTAGVEIRVLVELDLAKNRCGVEPGDAAVPLAQAIDKTKGLRFGGLQAYHGKSQHFRTHAERGAAVKGTCEAVEKTIGALKKAGLDCAEVSGGGTGTYPFEVASGLYTELQAGSYIFMDADYGLNKAEDGSPFSDFRQSLFVLATVISHPAADRMITDAGFKALSVDSGMPSPRDLGGIDYNMAGDEHGRLELNRTNADLKVGDKIQVVPSHCDTTVALYDWFVGLRGGRVEQVWPITARGATL